MGFIVTPKRNSCVALAFSNTYLKMYGKGTKIDEILESATIDTSFTISRLNVAIAFNFSEHVYNIIDNILKNRKLSGKTF